MHNIIARYQFTLANSMVLPKALGSVHRKHGSPYVSSIVQSCIAALIIGLTALLGLDPNTQVFAWGNGIGTFGYFIALCLTCLSTIVFFARNKNLQHGIWKTRIAPGLAFVGLFTFLVLSIIYVPYLTGGSAAIGYVLIGIVVAVGAAGAAVTVYFKKTGSPRYDGIVALTQERELPQSK